MHSGDYYRDNSPISRPNSQRNLRPMSSFTGSGNQQQLVDPRTRSMAGLSQWGPGSAYGMPNPMFASNPFMNGSPSGSDYGGAPPSMAPPNMFGMGPPQMMSGMSQVGAPRNSVMTNLNGLAGAPSMYGQPLGGSQMGAAPPSAQLPRAYSSYSLLDAGNSFGQAQPVPAPLNYSQHPEDEEIIRTLKADLACQDLTTISKRQMRMMVISKFPNADLSDKTAFINQNIDRLLSQS